MAINITQHAFQLPLERCAENPPNSHVLSFLMYICKHAYISIITNKKCLFAKPVVLSIKFITKPLRKVFIKILKIKTSCHFSLLKASSYLYTFNSQISFHQLIDHILTRFRKSSLAMLFHPSIYVGIIDLCCLNHWSVGRHYCRIFTLVYAMHPHKSTTEHKYK